MSKAKTKPAAKGTKKTLKGSSKMSNSQMMFNPSGPLNHNETLVR